MLRIRPLLWLSAIFLLPTFAAGLTPQTFLTLSSQPGDYIGEGITQTFTPSDGTFSVSNGFDTISVSFNSSSFSQFWYLDFGSPTSAKIGRGEYDGARRTPFRSPTRAGIDISGDGRGCNTDTGRFLITDFALNADGTIARLAIDFEQHCEGETPALFGSFRYNSSVVAEPRLAIASNYALKGNLGTSSAHLSLSLSLPSTTIVHVNYTSEDDTAVEGTDYVSTTGTATFEPGVTSQTISVPIIGNFVARGARAFKVKLSGASGAPIGAPTANVLIRDPNGALTALAMSSQTGDYIGLGQEYLITPSDGTFTPSNNANVVSFFINNGDDWSPTLAGPTTARLGIGDYENAQRYPFQPGGTPGMDISGAGRGCNTLTGNFRVLQAGYDVNGVLGSFSADFEQHCEGAAPALFGWLRYKTKLQQFSLTDAVIDGSSAVFTISLHPSNATSLSINFATVDGTATAGTDYLPISATVTFSPGMRAQKVRVPLLTMGQSKTFFGKLSAPMGVPIWIGEGSATF